MIYENFSRPDWWSRLMSLGSLIVAAAAVWYARVELPRLVESAQSVQPTQAAIDVDEAKAVLAQLNKAQLDQSDRAEQFDVLAKRLETSIAAADQAQRDWSRVLETADAALTADNDLLDPPPSARAATTARYDEPFAGDPPDDSAITEDELQDPSIDPDGELAGAGDSNAEAEPDGKLAGAGDSNAEADTDGKLAGAGDSNAEAEPKPDRLAPDIPAQPPASDLVAVRVVRVANKPLAEDDSPSVVLENTSEDIVSISRVTFQPLDHADDVSLELANKPFGQSTGSELVMAFSEKDNLAEIPNEQGTYRRSLEKAFQLPPGRQIAVRLAIEGVEHAGYALIGTLVIDFDNGQSIIRQDVPLAFIRGTGA